MQTITTVLFDFGGVVAEEGFRAALEKIAARNGLDSRRLIRTAFRLGYESGFSLGRVRENRYWPILKDETGLEEPEDSLTEEVLAHYTPRTWMLVLLETLKKSGYRVCMLSDQSHWLDDLNDRHGFFSYFDRVFSSYHMGISKKEVSTFTHVTDALGVHPSAVLFVDDHHPNVERAREAGLAAIHYRDRESFMKELRNVLGDTILGVNRRMNSTD
jgi:putative hydrolase of the HAD superfamily